MRILFSIILSLVLAFCQGQPVYPAEKKESSPSLAQGVDESFLGSYKIGRGDVLEINVWKEPVLSGEAIVRTDGMISLALVGDIVAQGRTPMALKSEIEERLREFIEDPLATVIVKNATSQKYYIIGEVRSPGEYDLVKDLSILQAIARAGGFGEWASRDQILLLRIENGMEKRIRINYKDIIKGKDPAQNVSLQANDTIVVP